MKDRVVVRIVEEVSNCGCLKFGDGFVDMLLIVRWIEKFLSIVMLL